MSDEIETEDKELNDMRDQINQLVETEKEKAEQEEAPHPEPEVKAPESPEPDSAPVAPPEAKAEGKDPLEWAKKKGFNTPEDMARALLQKDQEFHQSRQKAEREAAPPPPPAINWQPRPDMGQGYPPPQYGYPPPQARTDYRDVAALYPQLDPDDVRRVMPLILDAAKVISQQDKAELERKYGQIERTTQRNNELMSLMQDPAFKDERVQKEIHSILDADPTIFQRERTPFAFAFKEAVFNMGRKQLQQGMSEETAPTKPPVTAGGGNGSANTSPSKVSTRDTEKWTADQLGAFIKSGGKIVPKR